MPAERSWGGVVSYEVFGRLQAKIGAVSPEAAKSLHGLAIAVSHEASSMFKGASSANAWANMAGLAGSIHDALVTGQPSAKLILELEYYKDRFQATEARRLEAALTTALAPIRLRFEMKDGQVRVPFMIGRGAYARPATLVSDMSRSLFISGYAKLRDVRVVSDGRVFRPTSTAAKEILGRARLDIAQSLWDAREASILERLFGPSEPMLTFDMGAFRPLTREESRGPLARSFADGVDVHFPRDLREALDAALAGYPPAR
jgi:hypothetical protein